MTEILAITRTGDICLTVFLFLVGLVLIIKGGDWFVDSASKIAEMSGVPQFIIGATVVSIGTTLPELITSSIAAGEGNAAIAIGNAVGSVNANIGLIMAVSLLFLPHAFDKKAYLFKGITMILSIVILFLMCLKGYLNAYLSIILLVVFIVFIAENIIVGKKKRQRINLSTTARIPLLLTRTATPPSPETQPPKAQTRTPQAPKTKDERRRKKHYLLYSRHGVYRRRRATSRNFRQQTRGIYGRPRKNRRNHPCRNRHVAARTCHDDYVDYQEKTRLVHRQYYRRERHRPLFNPAGLCNDFGRQTSRRIQLALHRYALLHRLHTACDPARGYHQKVLARARWRYPCNLRRLYDGIDRPVTTFLFKNKAPIYRSSHREFQVKAQDSESGVA